MTQKAVEAVCEHLPELNSKSPLAFTGECIDMINQGTLVVSTKDEEVLWVLDFICKKETHGLKTLLSSINIVTKEQIIGHYLHD